MSKYDFKLDLSEKTSTGKLIDKIVPGSTVLEFGCATGRMTKYMSVVLNCEVYIVEYDSEAYGIAIQYAKNGLCDDIQKLNWLNEFEGIEFDYIVFADVLEHLNNPMEVVKGASSLLSKNGKILISIPNITHNDIIIKAVSEHFDYTKTGLLDDTHVHFWGLNNLEEFATASGLCIESIEATYAETGTTEQFADNVFFTDPDLLNVLKRRSCGEVYQYVFCLAKERNCETKVDITPPVQKCRIYFDRGNGYSEKNSLLYPAHLSANNIYYLGVRIEDVHDLKQIRIDPIESQGCIIKYLFVRQGKSNLNAVYADSAEINEGILLGKKDPMIFIDCESEEPISIEMEYCLFGTSSSELFLESIRKLSDNISCLKGELARSTQEYENEIARIQADHSKNYNELKQQSEAMLNSLQAKLESRIAELSKQNEQIRKDYNLVYTNLDSYRILVDAKDVYIINLNNELSDLHKKLEDRNFRLNELDNAVKHYQGMFIIKVGRKIKNFLRKIKHKIFRH